VEKGIQMGIVVPQITADWRWSWMKKANMKGSLEEDMITPSVAPTITPPSRALPPTPPPPPPAPPLAVQPDTEEEDPTVFVDIGGEMVEMTPAQAQALFT
jgi:hypothetical protein